MNNSKYISYLKYFTSICLLLGLSGIILCIIYFSHSWNYSGYRCYDVQDKFNFFLGFTISIVVLGMLTWLCSLWYKKSKFSFISALALVVASLTYIACIGNTVTAIVSIIKFDTYSRSIELDNALASQNSPMHDVSIDLFLESIGRVNVRYGYSAQVVGILRIEAKNNNAQAQNELGRHYFYYKESHKNQPDYGRAIYWFMKAYENGDPAGAFNVGICYDMGWGVDENIYEAVAWTKKAAEKGYASAELKMGDYYKMGVSSWRGIWCERELETADNRIYQFAISTGKTQYSEEVLPKDISKAKYWWQRALSHGDDEAIQRLESFYQE